MSRAVRTYSIRSRLLVALLASIACVWLATAVFSYFDARHELDELLDAHLAQSVSLLFAQTGHEPEEIDTEHLPLLHKRARNVAIQIWEGGKSLRLHSSSAPAQRLSARDEGFSDATIDGQRWRVFSAWDPEKHYLVQVGERYESRNEIASGLVKNLLLPLLFALPLLGLLVWLNVTRGLQPLAALGREVSGRDPGNLGSLDSAHVPLEVAPLVHSLNQLFARVAQLIDSERRFTADAAHELRTPLAGLKTQAQVARAATDGAERAHALDQVIAGCDRATHLVQQLLTLARLDPEERGGAFASCDLQALVRACVAELAPYAMAKQVDIVLEEGAALPLPGHAGLIAILLRNLVDNAVRYSPAGACVRARATRAGDAAIFNVTDQGSGLAPEERRKVGQRFYRVLGNEEFGSGLGLSIVKRIADLHGAEVVLEDNPQGKGLSATVRFRV